jgi:hypothetical protein
MKKPPEPEPIKKYCPLLGRFRVCPEKQIECCDCIKENNTNNGDGGF